MAKDDDLFSWNKPVPRDSVAGGFSNYAARVIQTGVQASDSFRTDVRYVGSTKVTLHTNQGMPWVVTETPDITVTREGCPPSDYGFLDLTTFGSGGDDYPGGDATPLRVVYDQGGAIKQPKFLRDTSDQKSFFRSHLPSLYTGTMRTVVQILHSWGQADVMKRDDLWDDTLQDLRIQRGFSVTHGIYTNSTGKRWIIEVGSSGVFRIPVEFCKSLPADWETLHAETYSEATAAAFKSLAKFWTVTRINWAGYEQIGPAPTLYTNGEGAYYSNCGWAFNRRGTQAVNTGIRVNPDDPMGARKLSTLYRLQITEDASGVPSSTTVTVVEQGEIVNTFDDRSGHNGPAILQVPSPVYEAQGLYGYCQTLPLYPGTIGPFLHSTSAPVFAYYDETDALHIVYFTPSWAVTSTSSATSYNDAVATYADSAPIPSGNYSTTASVHGSDPAWPYEAGVYSPGVLGASWGSESDTTAATMRFSSAVVTSVDPSHTSSESVGGLQTYGGTLVSSGAFAGMFPIIEWSRTTTTTNKSTGIVTVSTDRPCRIASLDSSAQLSFNVIGVIRREESTGAVYSNHQCLVIHGYDRTSYAVFTRRRTDTVVQITYSGTPIAFVEDGTFVYTGIYGTADYRLGAFNYTQDFETATEITHVDAINDGISKWPSGYFTRRGDLSNSVSPPVSPPQTTSATVNYGGSVVVVGSAGYQLDITSDTMQEPHHDGEVFFYKAGGNTAPGEKRGFYQLRENMTESQVENLGALTQATAHVNGFIGYF